MSSTYIIGCIIILLATVHLTRALPLLLFKNQITNRFVRSILSYLPYAILTSLIFPGVFMQKIGLIPSILGFVTAVILAFRGKGLIVVMAGATIVAYIAMLFNPQLSAFLGL